MTFIFPSNEKTEKSGRKKAGPIRLSAFRLTTPEIGEAAPGPRPRRAPLRPICCSLVNHRGDEGARETRQTRRIGDEGGQETRRIGR